MAAKMEQPAKFGAFAVGVSMLLVVAFDKTPTLKNVGPLYFSLASILLLSPTQACFALFAKKPAWAAAPLIYLGIAMGVIFNVVSDSNVDRNLFPLEIGAAWLLVTPAIAAGSVVGWWLKRKTPSEG